MIFTGNRNRPESEKQFSAGNNIPFKEVEVYQTRLDPNNIIRSFKGSYFISPSGVESFTLKNEIGNTPVFCIGETTAREARKHSKHVILAEETYSG